MTTFEKQSDEGDTIPSDAQFRIIYYLSRFPSISETFIVNQIVEMIRRGHEIAIYDFKKGDTSIVHEKIRQYGLLDKTVFAPDIPSTFSGRAKSAIHLLRLTPRHLRIWRYTSSLHRFGVSSAVPFRRFPYCLHLAEHMEQFKPDVLHAHFGSNAILPMCAQKAGVCSSAQMLVTFHGCDLHNIRQPAYKDLFHHAQLFTVNSNYAYRLAVSIGCPKEKLAKLPMGVDCNQFMHRPNHGKNERTDRIKIIYVGRLIAMKGIEVAIQSVARLREICSMNIQFTIIGDGELRASAQQLVEGLNLREVVVFLGSLSQEEIIKQFSESDIFLFPGVTAKDGRQEKQGIVIQEAQAMGLPVVVSRIGGIPEGLLDAETGFICPEGDIDAIAKTLHFLINHPEKRVSMGKKGAKFVKKNFDICVLSDSLEQLYGCLRNENVFCGSQPQEDN